MAKTLELEFVTEFGKSARLSIDNPKEPIVEAVLKTAMEEMITSGVFTSTNGNFASIKGARVIDRNVTEYEII
ncbi:DUF2922 domain-containing protein [Neobacillus niacini]|uniref:DUF2922 domain-containing protein n=1 Tax=Neobacillus niacini TaxID=86668 RepID=UPI00052FC091|nr:DUF2922 domain-containing protein [Neobacillus niacini]KGM45997.1 hypothetical protein NP83_02705 [Neobacillus niacini]MEC1522049.1 DUF2922 domain-containing protein [Neobacillus niacini]